MITEASYSAPAADGLGKAALSLLDANALQAASMQHANGLHSPLDPVVTQRSPHAQQSIGSPVAPSTSAAAAAAMLPSSLMCPLTGGVMTDPVVAADGVTYERAAINEWLQQRDVSPVTGMPLSSRCVQPFRAMLNKCARCCASPPFRCGWSCGGPLPGKTQGGI